MRLRQEEINMRVRSVKSFVLDRRTSSEALQLFLIFVSDNTEQPLDYLEFSYINTNLVVPEYVAPAICNVSSVSFFQTILDTKQLDIIFHTIKENSVLHIKNLYLSDQNLAGVASDTLGAAACRLQHLNISGTKLSTDQLNKLFSAIYSCCHLRLQRLMLNKNNLAKVVPDMFAAAVTRLSMVDLPYTQLTTHQLHTLALAIRSCSLPRIRRLDLTGNNLSRVSQAILAPALCMVRTAILCRTKLGASQLENLCKTITECSEIKLEYLDLKHNQELVAVSSEDLASPMCRITELDLSRWEGKLTSDQLELIFTSVKNCSVLKLKEVYLIEQDLSEVTPDNLALAICRLEVADLSSTGLTPGQLTTLLSSISNCSQLRLSSLNLLGNDLSSVEPDILARAVARVEEVSLKNTRLTKRQLQALCNVIAYKETACRNIKYLDIADNDQLDNVEVEMFQTIVGKLDHIQI